MKRTFLGVPLFLGWIGVIGSSIASAQMPPAYPGAQSNQAMADAIRTVAKSTISSLKSLTEKSLKEAKTDEDRKKEEAQLQEVERTLKMLDQMKVTVYVTADPVDKVKKFYEEKLKITFKDQERSLEEWANGLKLNGFDKVNPEDFKGIILRRYISRDKEKRLDIEITDKGIDPNTGKIIEKTIIHFASFPK
jgi:vacuolar-type H+-ATPase subunit I/STV1